MVILNSDVKMVIFNRDIYYLNLNQCFIELHRTKDVTTVLKNQTKEWILKICMTKFYLDTSVPKTLTYDLGLIKGTKLVFIDDIQS